ncbi:hypothetical protein A3A35_01890 [Candidatus Kaiserbacteria bacterium RIFCSPLOWO2_01_FULL_51_21]|uniref:Uncharacterized protein n=1 Tax=Candidatus Kaiserbacteria bacterium RIFCSPLOWO2_01_FULL_51_21 TaxID=1798508 RepID=A0A1F6EDM1_9BACT|nr:MAG: hypothetical protein A3A35_01890 [Candidatus Kaiserbacteria bacterium RIFCSPLOWO2_01_FULL_51_21]
MQIVPYYTLPHDSRSGITLAFRLPLTEKTLRERFEMPLRDGSTKYLENLAPIGRELVEEIAKVDGIFCIHVQRHDCEVIHSKSYRWNGDVGPKVLQAVKVALEKHGYEAKRRRRRKSKKQMK